MRSLPVFLVAVLGLTGTTKAGESLRARGVDLLRFRDGKIVSKDSYWKIVQR